MNDVPTRAAQRIIAKFGGSAKLANALSSIREKPVPASTVRSWQNVGIPVKWHQPVLEAGKVAAVGIAIEDFFGAESTP